MGDQTTLDQRLTRISPLDRRIVELELADLFTEAATERWGAEAALNMLRDVVRRAAGRSAEAQRRRQPEPTLLDMLEVWRNLGGDGRLEIDLEELSPRTLRFRVKRCAYADAYRALKLERLGVEFSCRRDEPFARALIPGLRLKQSATILEGHPDCVFEYSLDLDDEA